MLPLLAPSPLINVQMPHDTQIQSAAFGRLLASERAHHWSFHPTLIVGRVEIPQEPEKANRPFAVHFFEFHSSYNHPHHLSPSGTAPRISLPEHGRV